MNRVVALAGLICVLLPLAGCGRRASVEPPPARDATAVSDGAAAAPSVPHAANRPTPSSPSDAATAASDDVAEGLGDRILPESDLWNLLSIGGQRIGHGHTSIRHMEHEGQPAMTIRGEVHMAVRRFSQSTEQEIRFECLETPDGKLIEFQSLVSQGQVPMRTRGVVDGETLRLTTETAGRTEERSVAWSPRFGAFFAVDQSLMRRPMRPGERRTIEALELGLGIVATHELRAERFEPVELPSGRFDLLRIVQNTQLGPGAALTGQIWIDRQGHVMKTRIDAMGLESVRATRDVALAETAPAELDFGWDVAVPLDRPLPDAHRNARARYRVTLDDGDPREVFVSGRSQRVEPGAARNVAVITVWAMRPDVEGNAAADPANREPTDADRNPSSIIQSDDPRIVQLAEQAIAGADSPWAKAVAAERLVHEYLTEKGFSQAFATAAEVAESREGDCSEHSVLLMALLRAAGIPARAAAGLVYADDRQSFYYHMWVEAYVDGRWIPLDATLGLGGTGAGHLKLADSSLDSAASFTAFLPVIRVLGKLDVELLDVRPPGKAP